VTDQGEERVAGAALDVRHGEIYGLAGAAGEGQAALIEAVVGRCRAETGRVYLGDEDVTGASVMARRQLGLAYLPSPWEAGGLIGTLTLLENAALGQQRRPVQPARPARPARAPHRRGRAGSHRRGPGVRPLAPRLAARPQRPAAARAGRGACRAAQPAGRCRRPTGSTGPALHWSGAGCGRKPEPAWRCCCGPPTRRSCSPRPTGSGSWPAAVSWPTWTLPASAPPTWSEPWPTRSPSKARRSVALAGAGGPGGGPVTVHEWPASGVAAAVPWPAWPGCWSLPCSKPGGVRQP
jgi:energy-coupling factor transporter ATP-binding protein EcfA2